MKVIDACVSLFCRFLFLFILPTHLEGTKRWVGEGEPIISIAMIVGGGEGEKKNQQKKVATGHPCESEQCVVLGGGRGGHVPLDEGR